MPANTVVSAFMELTIENHFLHYHRLVGILCFLCQEETFIMWIYGWFWSCPGFSAKWLPEVWAGSSSVGDGVGREYRSPRIQEIKLLARAAPWRSILCPIESLLLR